MTEKQNELMSKLAEISRVSISLHASIEFISINLEMVSKRIDNEYSEEIERTAKGLKVIFEDLHENQKNNFRALFELLYTYRGV